jgi:anti-sigma regulatory factor (Ser/Thr protein kinase)
LSKGIRSRGENIRTYILNNLDGPGLAQKIAERFHITRQAAGLHLQRLVDEGALVPEGNTRNRTYKLSTREVLMKTYEIVNGLDENFVWRNDIHAALAHLPKNVLEMWEYSFTEMFNNAIDHSNGTSIAVTVCKTAINTQIWIKDNGVGIFAKIKAAMGLEDERHAILELVKGKLTTDSRHHSGEGIFFTSRMVSQFDVYSGNVRFSHEVGKPWDWVLDYDHSPGTRISLQIDNQSPRTMKGTLAEFSVNDQYGFNRTVVPVRLAQYENDQLISRSQAKRLLARVELFADVQFDFARVESIGKPFADQIFRVFQNEHPNIHLHVIRANTAVLGVVNEVQHQRKLEQKEEAKTQRETVSNG